MSETPKQTIARLMGEKADLQRRIDAGVQTLSRLTSRLAASNQVPEFQMAQEIDHALRGK